MAFRLTIIGGGPGGYSAAFRAAASGAEVTLIERDRIGGTCLHSGCIPTKTLKASADALESARSLDGFGIRNTGVPAPDMRAVIARKNAVCDLLRGGLVKTAGKHKVRLIQGTGRVLGGKEVAVTARDGSVASVKGDAVIIAAGSRCLELPGMKFDHKTILSSDDALSLQTLPRRIVILGGGVAGCELGFIFRGFGSEVTVVEGQNRLLPIPGVDEDMSRLLAREMKKRGIGFHPSHSIIRVEEKTDGILVHLGQSPRISGDSNAPGLALEADMLFVTAGRAPKTEELGLAEAGVETDGRGWVRVNDKMRTSLRDVYALGDVLGPAKIMLAHAAIAEARVAVDTCLGIDAVMDYSVMPSAIFTSPEIGCVGLTETQALERGFDVAVATVQVRELGKAHASGELAGQYKLVAEKTSGKLLGAHLAGAHAAEMIAASALALRLGATASDLARTIHAHPTFSEGVWEVAGILARD